MTFEEVDVNDTILSILNNYSCMVTHEPLYIKEKLERFAKDYKVLNFKLFYQNQDKIETVIGVVDDFKESNKIVVWAHECRGADTYEQLKQEFISFSEFMREYLKKSNKDTFWVNIKWKDYKPANRLSNEIDWLNVLKELNGVYFKYEINQDEKMIFEMV